MKKRYVTLLMLMMLTLSVAAQQLTVKSFTPTNQIIAGDDRKTDWNNVPCALIKVQGAEVDSVAGVFEVVRRGPELWAYVTNGRRSITIYKHGFEASTVNFSDFNVEGAESNKVYLLVISTPAASATEQEKKADYLTLWVTPYNAAVSIDGRSCSVDTTEGTVTEVLTFGLHTIQVQSPGYETVNKNIQFTKDNRVHHINLTSLMTEVVIQATTPGTVIFVNNEQRGTDRCTLQLAPRTYIIKGEKAGHASQEVTFTISDDATTQHITIPALRAITGSADINFKPTGSQIFIDGKSVGTSPHIIDDLSVGSHTLEVKCDGYNTFKQTIIIKEKENLDISGTLFKAGNENAGNSLSQKPQNLQNNGTLNAADNDIHIRCLTRNARIFVNDSLVGVDQLLVNNLTGGTYILRASKDGFEDDSIIVTLSHNEYRQVVIPALKKAKKEIVQQNSNLNMRVEGTYESFVLNGITFYMIKVESGSFSMGATNEQGSRFDSNERPTHRVTLSNFSIGETEVTQELWEAVMGSNPSFFLGSRLPVELVSWEDCQAFITKLNELLEGQLSDGKKFRLPTEAEWEFAARGGNLSKGYRYAGGNSINPIAWQNGNSENKTHGVGSKLPNELGIYDMSGNVMEWCNDWYDGYDSADQANPTGPQTGNTRVCRGGCWNVNSGDCRVSYRFYLEESYSNNNLGLRLAR